MASDKQTSSTSSKNMHPVTAGTKSSSDQTQTDKPSPQVKLLVVLGEGGHTTELLNLVDHLGDLYDYHYVISREDNLSAGHIRRPGPLYRVIRPRGKQTGLLRSAFRTVGTAIESLWVLIRVRPTAILSAGPAIAVPVSIIGRTLGARIIFVETGSRIQSLSLTGRIMYRWANLFFVQWPQLKEKLPADDPRVIYAGRLV